MPSIDVCVITRTRMDELLDNPLTKDITGIPIWGDDSGRVLPKAAKAFEQPVFSNTEGVQFDAKSSPQRAAYNSDNVTPSFPQQPVGKSEVEEEAILNTLGDLKEPWDRLRTYINATPELISLLYDLDLMPEQIHVRRNFVRMMQLAEWYKHYRAPERESGELTNAQYEAIGCAAHNAIGEFHGDAKIPHYMRHIGKKAMEALSKIEVESSK